MMGNNPMLDLVNVDAHTKFGLILSSHFQDIEWKPNVHGITERWNHRMTEGQDESSIAPLFQSGAIISTTLGFLCKVVSDLSVSLSKIPSSVQIGCKHNVEYQSAQLKLRALLSYC